MMRRSLATILLLCVALVPFASRAADPYELNVILPLTGGAAFLAKEEVAAMGVAEKLVNDSGGIQGRPIKFTFLDDQTNPQVAVQLANQVISKHVPVVFGSTIISLCSAMAPLMKDGPVQYCFAPGIYPERGSYVFTSSFKVVDYLQAVVRYFRLKGWKKVAMVFSNDATGQDAENAFNAAFAGPEGGGEEIIDREHFNLNDISVSAQLSRVKASGAQVMIGWVTGTGFGTLLRSASDVGLQIPLLGSTSNLIYAQLEGYGSFIGSNVMFAAVPGDVLDSLPRGAMRNAVASYMAAMKAGGVRPDQGHTLAWDPALLVVAALRKYGTNATALQIRDYLASVKGWTGINGTYDFDKYPQRGLGTGSIVVVQWDPSKGTWVGVSALGGTPLR